MRSEWDVLHAARTQPIGFLWGYMACNAMWAVVLVLSSCASTFVPSGRPGCAPGHAWSDSLSKCVEVPR